MPCNVWAHICDFGPGGEHVVWQASLLSCQHTTAGRLHAGAPFIVGRKQCTYAHAYARAQHGSAAPCADFLLYCYTAAGAHGPTPGFPAHDQPMGSRPQLGTPCPQQQRGHTAHSAHGGTWPGQARLGAAGGRAGTYRRAAPQGAAPIMSGQHVVSGVHGCSGQHVASGVHGWQSTWQGWQHTWQLVECMDGRVHGKDGSINDRSVRHQVQDLALLARWKAAAAHEPVGRDPRMLGAG